MPDFTYSGSDERYYPSLSLDVKPGDSVTLESDPGDGRFSLAGSAPKPDVAPPPVPDPDPVDDLPGTDSFDAPEVGA